MTVKYLAKPLLENKSWLWDLEKKTDTVFKYCRKNIKLTSYEIYNKYNKFVHMV